jgi:hypothetical protein
MYPSEIFYRISSIMQRLRKNITKFPFHGWIGVLLILLFWWVNWTFDGLRTHWGFTPLWVGYCLMIDGLVYSRKSSSLLKRNWRAYLGLFGVSVIGWWLFEFLNWRVQNWTYLGSEYFTKIEFAIMATFSFSSVIPAVFGTAELVGSFSWIKNLHPGWRLRSTKTSVMFFFILGWTMLVLMLVWPRYFFPFMWLSVYFILEPINVWLGNRTLAEVVDRGDWRPVFAIWIGSLVCGFFWEMWNYYSYPKWIYHVPFVDFSHIFEMPILGYGGYLPFGMELFALYHFVSGLFGRKKDWKYLNLV